MSPLGFLAGTAIGLALGFAALTAYRLAVVIRQQRREIKEARARAAAFHAMARAFYDKGPR